MTRPAPDHRWSAARLALLLSPFVYGAVAINLFMLGLIGQAIGLPALSPKTTLIAAVPLTLPAAWATGRWVRSLLDQAA